MECSVRPEQLERDPGLARVHREVPADREHGHLGRVDAPISCHVAEDARVAGEVDRRAVLKPDDDPGGLAEVVAVVRELEWKAFVERELDPAASTVPPLFEPGACFSTGAPWAASQPFSSTMRDDLGPNFFASSTVSPTWSPWPCVSAITSTRSGSFSDSGHFGFPSQGST